MNLVIDKKYFDAKSTSYGYYVDDDGNTFPFEYNETREEGERVDFSISWDDDNPENRHDVEEMILEVFGGDDE